MSVLENEVKSMASLITEMTMKNASSRELERVIEHSQAVIDARRSERENKIQELKDKYL